MTHTSLNPDTSPFYKHPAILAGVVAVALQVGTGGVASPSYLRDRGQMGYAFARFAASPDDNRVEEATPTENLSKVRSVLNPSVADLARTLNVSRQSIYDWQSGGSITPENAKKLNELARAADVFVAEGLTATNQLLRREVGGQSFFDKVRSGGSAEDAARQLINIARREAEQRQMLDRRLKGRVPSAISADEIGAPNLSEQE